MATRVQVVDPARWSELARGLEALVPLPYLHHRDVDRGLAHRYLMRWLDRAVTANESVVLLAEAEGGERGIVVLRDLPWDTAHFGWRCGRLSIFVTRAGYAVQRALADALLSAALDLARARGIVFLWTKCSSDLFPVLHALEEQDFRLMDCELTLVYEGEWEGEASTRYRVEFIRARRVAALEELGELFTLSRFHADPRIPTELVDGLWRRSIAEACQGSADAVIALYDGTRPAGFVVCKDDALAGEVFPWRVRSFFLVGVAPDYQGQGVGRELMSVALAHSLPVTPLVEVETQSRNQAALALYQRVGFRIAASTYAFHRWL